MKRTSSRWYLLLLRACLLEAFLIQFVKAENADDPKHQSTVLQKCCSSHDAGQLWDCVKKETQSYSNALLNKSPAFTVDMVVTTFATDNIADYAVYSMAIMATWAQQHDYPMRIYSPADDGDGNLFDTYDPRWNKVPVIRHALTQWAPQTFAALWVDADLTVLDFSTTVQHFLNHPSLASSSSSAQEPPHLWVCAEHAGSTTYTNTGSFLASNNPRTVELLDLWWTIADRRLHSDQESLDLVLNHLRRHTQQPNGEDSSSSLWHFGGGEVHVLPTSFFNSNPPAMTQLEPTDRAIHLMGSTTPYRAAVFGRAWEETCQAFSQGRPPAHQLGITRQFLLNTALSVHGAEYVSALAQIEQFLVDQPPEGSAMDEQHLLHLQKVALPLTHAMMHTGDSETAVHIDYQVRDAFERVIHSMRSVGRSISPDLLQKKIAQALKCMRHPRSNEPVWVIFDNVTTDLDELEGMVNPKQMASVVQMRASLEQHIVHDLIERGKWEPALERQFGVIELLQRDDIMEHNQIKPLGTLANLLCQAKRYDEALPHFAKVIDLQTRHFGASHPSVAVELLNRGICLYESGKYRDAMRDLAKAKRIYQASNFPPDNMELQRAIHFHRLANTASIKEDL